MRNGFGSAWDRRRCVRLSTMALLGVGVFAAFALAPPWFSALVPPPALRRAIIRLLLAAQTSYWVLLAASPIALIALAGSLLGARRRGNRRPWTVRGFALGAGLMGGLALAEGTAGAWLSWTKHPLPRLSTEFPDPPGQSRVDILLLGESSARGVPYHEWLSVGEIVAWKLREAFPDREFPVEHLALPGLKLDNVHFLLGTLTRRPDLVILYAGHNEFPMRYDWGHGAQHYLDETPPLRVTLAGFAREYSPLCRLIQQTVSRIRGELPPVRTVARELVDVPVYTAAEYAERLDDFRTRLEAIVAYCERVGALTVLVIPPSNDADFEPNRSFLPPDTPRAERAAFAREFQATLRAEAADPIAGIAAYRALLAWQPGFAETHYRLARRLEAAGQVEEAHRHYVAARDGDGLPLRCPSDFLDVYRDVAARHPGALLVDGPAVLGRECPRGTAGDESFTDGLHPSLAGYTTLARAILRGLHARRAFGWNATADPPVVTPAECAAHFGMDPTRWKEVCDYAAWFYLHTAFIRFDPSERLAKRSRYLEAARRLADGAGLDELAMPGIGPDGSEPGSPSLSGG